MTGPMSRFATGLTGDYSPNVHMMIGSVAMLAAVTPLIEFTNAPLIPGDCSVVIELHNAQEAAVESQNPTLSTIRGIYRAPLFHVRLEPGRR